MWQTNLWQIIKFDKIPLFWFSKIVRHFNVSKRSFSTNVPKKNIITKNLNEWEGLTYDFQGVTDKMTSITLILIQPLFSDTNIYLCLFGIFTFLLGGSVYKTQKRRLFYTKNPNSWPRHLAWRFMSHFYIKISSNF